MSSRHYPWVGRAIGAALGALVLAAARRVQRIEVSGASMRPHIQQGDRLVILRGLRVRPSDIVAVRDPRDRRRVMVKRVRATTAGGLVHVAGDDPSASTDSRHFGPVPAELVLGRAVWRYWPEERRGRLSR